jgi:cold shock protein
MQTVAQGKVKLFNEKKGFGYIEIDSGKEVLVLQTAIQKTGLKTLTFGQLVKFDLVQGPQGSVAENIRVL